MDDFIDQLRGIVTLRKDGRYLRGLCPFHVEKSASFTVFPDGRYKCFGCGAFGYVSKLLGKPSQQPNDNKQREPEKIWPIIDWTPFRKAFHLEHANRLKEWRGYSIDFIREMVKCGWIGVHRKQFCFPIHQREQIRRVHVRRDEREKHDQDFYYYPKEGCGCMALVIQSTSNLAIANLFESQWDCFAVMEQHDDWRKEMWIITRGSMNAHKLASVRMPAVRRLWPQSDQAGEWWLSGTVAKDGTNRNNGVLSYLPQTGENRIVRMPQGVKDANDFFRGYGTLYELRNFL